MAWYPSETGSLAAQASTGAECFRVALAAAVILLSSSVSALQVEDLYTARVLVTDESSSQLRSGARAGLLQVLVRVSGDSHVERNAAVRVGLRTPDRYYYQYSYGASEHTLQVGADRVPARVLQLEFEPNAIAGLLREAGLPVWGSNRPGVMVWIAVDDGDSREVLLETDTGPTGSSLASHAARRGLPLLYPLGDLSDSDALSVAEVWGSFLDRVETASARYGADSILTGRVLAMGDQYAGRFSYRVDETWRDVEAVTFGTEELVRRVIDQMADEMASMYAIDSGRNSVQLQVEAVDSLLDYAELNRYLTGLTPVVDLFVLAVDGEVVRLRLDTEGASASLIELIELDQRLHLLATDGDLLQFRWLSKDRIGNGVEHDG